MIGDLDFEVTPYTDFVTIGGDGTFCQTINSYQNHPQKDKLWKIPFGVLPGGSGNVLSWALGCGNEYTATSQILKGEIIESDIIETILDDGRSIFGQGFTYGIASDAIVDSKRNYFGKHRYFIK